MTAPVALRRKRLPGDAGPLRSMALLGRTAWRADRRRVGGVLAVTIGDQIAQLGSIVATAVIIDAAASGDRDRAVAWAFGFGLLVAVSYAFNALNNSLANGLRERISMAFEARLVALLASLPGIDHFERPELLDRVELIRQERWALSSIVSSTTNFLTIIVQLTITSVILVSVSPWLLLLPVMAGVPMYTAVKATAIYKAHEDETAEAQRLAIRLYEKALEPAAAAELRLHGLGPVVLGRHRGAYDRLLTGRRRVAVKTAWLGLIGDGALVVAQLAAIVLIVNRAVYGGSSAGEVVLTATLAFRLRWQVYWVVGGLDWVLRTLRAVGRLAWVEGEVARAGRAAGESPPDAVVPARLRKGIRFEGVSFEYPGTSVPVLEGVDLFLPAGSTVAVVGENGAGKTTIVKLLCRFYDVTAGQITVDGVDLRRMPVDEWRARLSGAFQDHARLEFLARETVGVGDLAAVEDDGAVLAALDRAGASPVLRALPGGLATQLGTRFEDGVELSGGQWQQLALGRGMMRAPVGSGGPLVVVLDEPTAALDPGTEHRLFERYAALARSSAAESGAVTVLVSHRFSTVRMADLIVVVDDGRIVETGSHDELVARRGLYAELYGLQARAYGA